MNNKVFVYLPEDGRVRDLVQLIHEKVDGIIPYPPNDSWKNDSEW